MSTHTAVALDQPLHPYYPLGSDVAAYAENEWSILAILGVFSGACVVLLSTTGLIARKVQPSLRASELAVALWFVLSGFIHVFFEGYYITHYANLAAQQTVMGQMWKEYALSDSRYLTQNSFVLCVEFMTVVCTGPGCLLVASLIVARHALRFPLQALVSFAHLYGDTLYYATAVYDHVALGISYSRPEPFYFWIYFIFMNSFWIIVPSVLIYQSTIRAASAIAMAERLENSKKSD